MPKIVIKNLDNKIISYDGSRNNVLMVLQDNFIDWMHACGGKGRCTTCKMIVEEGMENLSALTPHESRFQELNALKNNERLTCQCSLTGGELQMRVPDSGKLPHIEYSD